jgi:hypothetical protein
MSETNKGLELAQQMGDFVNSSSNREKTADFIDGFCRQHRTLQQSSFRLMLALFEHMASDAYRTDLRNEASAKVAKKLLAGFKAETYKELLNGGCSEKTAKDSSESEFYMPSKYLPFI